MAKKSSKKSGKGAKGAEAKSRKHPSGKASKKADAAEKPGERDAAAKGKGAGRTAHGPVADLLRLPAGPVDLSTISTGVLPFGPDSKKEAAKDMAELAPRLERLQEKLFAQSTDGDRRSVLLLLQGMDTAGKDGVIQNAVGALNPGALELTSFKSPTPEELSHEFLWRIESRVPKPGQIGVFNRSQYEDVLIVRVHDLVPREIWSKRYAMINAFERRLARQGVVLVKCFLHISKAVQAERLLARLDDPTKYWKYNPGDVDERGRWDDYQLAYTEALRRCNTVAAPWYVIPSDVKWYRNWLVAKLLEETLNTINPDYPAAGFDVDVERQRVLDSM